MEELGTSTVFRPKVLSKSSDYLNQIEGTDREKRDNTKHQVGSEGNVQVGPDLRTFKERTSTAVNSWVRTSSVSGKEGKVTATASSPRGTSENNLIVRYHFLQFILLL